SRFWRSLLAHDRCWMQLPPTCDCLLDAAVSCVATTYIWMPTCSYYLCDQPSTQPGSSLEWSPRLPFAAAVHTRCRV
ncbi:hypothetical protein BHM03_00057649, partial [Ensete ventricosum]